MFGLFNKLLFNRKPSSKILPMAIIYLEAQYLDCIEVQGKFLDFIQLEGEYIDTFVLKGISR